MTPNRYTIKEDTTYFHYKFSDLRTWISRGNEFGDVGPLLFARKGNRLIYESYGTINNPMKSRVTLSIIHNPLFDGKLGTDDEIINPERIKSKAKRSYKLILIDMSK